MGSVEPNLRICGKLEDGGNAVDTTSEMVLEFILAPSTEVSKISYYCFSSRIKYDKKFIIFTASFEFDSEHTIIIKV